MPYGMQLVEGRLHLHEIEQVVIEKIGSLRADGFSYNKIAHILNALGILTKHKRSRWHATTVMKILRKRFTDE